MPGVPEYDSYQSSFHTAFAEELDRIVERSPLRPDSRALDVPCGDGFYSVMLARRLGPEGHLTAVDSCEPYLERARKRFEGFRSGGVQILQADAYHLPFPDGEFDFVWCAQSLVTLNPPRVVAEFRRVLRPGGSAVILEADEFHHVLLPWQAELEAAIPAAVLQSSRERFGDGEKLAPARRLRRDLKAAGFTAIRRRTVAVTRSAPFDDMTRRYLQEHCQYLRSLIRPKLPAKLQQQFDRETDDSNPASLFRRADAEFECLNVVYTASRPH